MRVPLPSGGGDASASAIFRALVVGCSVTVAARLKKTTPRRCWAGRRAANWRAAAIAASMGAPRIDRLVSMTSIAPNVLAPAASPGTMRRSSTSSPFSLTFKSPGGSARRSGSVRTNAFAGKAAPRASDSCPAGAACAAGAAATSAATRAGTAISARPLIGTPSSSRR